MALQAHLYGGSSLQVLDSSFASVAIIALALLSFAATLYNVKLNADCRNKETASKERISRNETEARNKEIRSKERIVRMQIEAELEETKMELEETKVKLEKTKMELKKTKMEPTYRLPSPQSNPGLTYRFLSSQLNPAAAAAAAIGSGSCCDGSARCWGSRSCDEHAVL
ncbi:hypothetical protein B0T24DRAFT_598287 [Lasiosphaeria ovina]|uniref:Uncharacterized protein n=1 Tax=Lasiosphaeria ovina TaxID=92902 RepID=A0AAE0JV90_9PEZI|nr:hypothetical protein B0T24DRAFT_598287 [Lasiosphaeria ovina]